jgi:transaldolase
MEIWLDTIDEDAIADAAKIGIISGVTTNPSILSCTKNIFHTLSRLLDLQPGPVAVQVTSLDPEEMIEEGLRIFEFSPRMIVKVPVNRNGLIAMRQLRCEKVPVLGTGILFPTQALLASNLRTSYIAPYFSHIDDVGCSHATLKTIVEMLRLSTTKILAASLKNLEQINFCASLGIAAVTIKADLYYKLMEDHPIVEGFFQRFLADWSETHGDLSIKEALQQNAAIDQ